MNILGIGLDYKFFRESQTRGDFRARLEGLSPYVNKLIRVVYSPPRFSNSEDVISHNIKICYTNSRNKISFIIDAYLLIKKILQTEKIDVVTAEDPFLGGFMGWVVKMRFKIPFNVQVNHCRIDNRHWLAEDKRNYILNMVGKFVLKNADSVRVVSEEARKHYVRVGISPENIFVAPTVILLDKFQNVDASDIRKKHLRDKFDRIILFVGRLSYEKNIPAVLKAFKLISQAYPKVVLLIVGGGNEERTLKAMATQLGLNSNVHFVGPVDYSKIPQYFMCSDIFVLSSFHEGRADVLFEAAFCKKPIISTPAGDAVNCVKDGETGFIVDIGDYEAMAEKAVYLLQNPEVMTRFGNAGAEFIKEQIRKYNSFDILVKGWEETKQRCSK